jgi:hypothetical protein
MHNIINEFWLLFFHCCLGLRNKYSLYRGFSFWLFTYVYSLIRHFYSKVTKLLKCLSYKKGSGFVTSFVYPATLGQRLNFISTNDCYNFCLYSSKHICFIKMKGEGVLNIEISQLQEISFLINILILNRWNLKVLRRPVYDIVLYATFNFFFPLMNYIFIQQFFST